MRAVKEKANAKINLYLDVISRREDGFHDIKTVMQSISLSDELTVSYKPSSATDVRVFVSGVRYLPTDDKNLAVRAARLFLERAGKVANIEIKLKKRIPIAAGLAGGSSDAAATLRAMNRLFDRLFADKVLFSMAAELGSDVPYCLYGKSALCEGRGEIITKLPDVPSFNVVVAIANERVSTPVAYTTLDGLYSNFDGSKETGGDACFARLMSAVKDGKVPSDGLFNIFEEAVLPTCNGASWIKKRLFELGAKSALMSGSGPSVFGIFETQELAELACSALRTEKFIAYTAKSV